jgi:hypothetical protein
MHIVSVVSDVLAPWLLLLFGWERAKLLRFHFVVIEYLVAFSSDPSGLVPPFTMTLLAKLVHLDNEDTSLNGVDHDVT